MSTNTAQTPRNEASARANALMTLDQAANYLSLGKRTLQERVSAGEIAIIKIGRSSRFSIEDLDAFVESKRIKARGWAKRAAR